MSNKSSNVPVVGCMVSICLVSYNLETLIVLVEITVFMYVHDLDCMQEGDGSPVRFQSTCHNSRYTRDILVIWSE